MDQELIKEGLKIIEQASYILEEISDQPGITPYEFIAALDSNGITEQIIGLPSSKPLRLLNYH